MKYLELGFMSHEKLVCNRFHEPRKLHSEISGVVKMRNDNLDFMGREYAFKYVPCWAMKPYTLISWAMKILKISFLDRITPWNVWKYCITLSDCYIKPQNLWPCCTMMDTLCFTTAIFFTKDDASSVSTNNWQKIYKSSHIWALQTIEASWLQTMTMYM